MSVEVSEKRGKDGILLAKRLKRGIWEDAKDETPEGRILEFADFLCVLGFFNHEHEGGNRTVHNHIQDMQGYFHIFHDKRFDFIRPLVDQSSLLMQEIFND